MDGGVPWSTPAGKRVAVTVMRAQLVPLDGGPAIDIVKDLTLIGRREECDVRLEHKSVSKMHCVVVKTDGLLLVRDLGSTNGTRVNGQRVRRAALLPNDQLSIASCKYRVHLGPDEPPAGPGEHTQHLEPGEVADLLRQAKQQRVLADSSGEMPAQPLQLNPLPDVYPDDEAKDK
jgi:predicted component of type VI protein secretion system